MNYQMRSKKLTTTRARVSITWDDAPRDIHRDVWDIVNSSVLRWEQAHPKEAARGRNNRTSAINGFHSKTSGNVYSEYVPLEERDAIVAQLREFMERVV